MAVVAASGEIVDLRMIYVAAGAIISAAGVMGLFVLEEPSVVPDDDILRSEVELAQAAAD
jgi:hypothetical protein